MHVCVRVRACDAAYTHNADTHTGTLANVFLSGSCGSVCVHAHKSVSVYACTCVRSAGATSLVDPCSRARL